MLCVSESLELNGVMDLVVYMGKCHPEVVVAMYTRYTSDCLLSSEGVQGLSSADGSSLAAEAAGSEDN